MMQIPINQATLLTETKQTAGQNIFLVQKMKIHGFKLT